MKRQFAGQAGFVFGPVAFGFWVLAVAAFLAVPWNLGHAAAPANDTCAGAEVISRDGPFPYLTSIKDIAGATTNVTDPPSAPHLAPYLTRSVWYQFTPATNALYTITTCSGGDPSPATTVPDTVMFLYTSSGGCNGPFLPFGTYGDEICGPDGSQALITEQLAADTTYYVVVWRYCESAGSCTDNLNDLQLMVTSSPIPPNDTCDGAIAVHVNLPVEGTTVGAANNFEISGTNAFGGIDQMPSEAPGRDVVYSFTAPESANYSFRVSRYWEIQNPVLYVVPACPGGPGPTRISNSLGAANRSNVNTVEEVYCLALSAGQTVFVIVDDDDTGNSGSSFTLEITRCVQEAEPNGSPATAGRLVAGVEGSISPQFDFDFYSLGQYPAGWRAFVLVDGEATKVANFDLRITTATDTLEYDDDNNDAPFGAGSPNVAGTILTGEPAFVSVNYFGGMERGPYRVFAAVQPPLSSAVPESEPNDALASANLTEQNYFYGALNGTSSPSTDVDFYAFGVAEGDLIYLSLDGDPYRTNAPLNAQLELVDQSGKTLFTVNDNGASSFGSTNIATNTLTAFGPSSPAEALVYRSMVEGVFFVRVSASSTAAGNAAAGNYLLSISKNGFTGADGVNHSPSFQDVAVSLPVITGADAHLSGAILERDIGDAASLVVEWGDGSSNVVQNSISGSIPISLTHRYNTGKTNLTIRLAARDRFGGTATTSLPVEVKLLPAPATFQGIERLSASQIRLRLAGSPEATYRVEKSDVLGGPWLELGIRTSDAAGIFSIDDLEPAPGSRFYRAVAVP